MTPCKIITISWETGEPTSKVTSWHNSLEEAKCQVRHNRLRAIRDGVWQTWLIKPTGQEAARYTATWQPPTK